MRSALVHAARKAMPNKFELARYTIRATRELHTPPSSPAHTINWVLMHVAKRTREDVAMGMAASVIELARKNHRRA